MKYLKRFTIFEHIPDGYATLKEFAEELSAAVRVIFPETLWVEDNCGVLAAGLSEWLSRKNIPHNIWANSFHVFVDVVGVAISGGRYLLPLGYHKKLKLLQKEKDKLYPFLKENFRMPTKSQITEITDKLNDSWID